MDSIPTTSGSYILWLKVTRKRRMTIGKLGEHLFLPGYYAYTGSAFGPGGLKARLTHHLKKPPRPHWHIDYLKKGAVIQEIWYSTERENLEHNWASTLSRRQQATSPVVGFGASDCHCKTHLIYFPEPQNQNNLIGNGISRLILPGG